MNTMSLQAPEFIYVFYYLHCLLLHHKHVVVKVPSKNQQTFIIVSTQMLTDKKSHTVGGTRENA